MMKSSLIARRLHVAFTTCGLTETTSLDSISIKDICDVAGISKATFYRTFEDKYAILAWIIDLTYRAGIDDIGRIYTWEDGLFVSLSGVELVRSLMTSGVASQGPHAPQEVGARRFKKSIERSLLRRFSSQGEKCAGAASEFAFQVDFFTEMSTLMVNKWLKAEPHVPCEKFARDLASCVPADLKAAIELPESMQPARRMDIAAFSLIAMKADDSEGESS